VRLLATNDIQGIETLVETSNGIGLKRPHESGGRNNQRSSNASSFDIDRRGASLEGIPKSHISSRCTEDRNPLADSTPLRGGELLDLCTQEFGDEAPEADLEIGKETLYDLSDDPSPV